MESYFKIRYINRRNHEELEMPLEKMVGILLSLEMDTNFHIEALKAQAIAIRTNLVKNPIVEGEGMIEGWEKDDENKGKIKKAVDDTQGLVILFNDKPIDAKYHLSCGGSTENSENVVNHRIAYLRRVLCEHCKNNIYWRREKDFTLEDMERLLKVKFPKMDIGTESEIIGFIEDVEKDEHGRVKSLRVAGEKISGKELAKLLNLNSTRYSIFPTGVKFITRGKGHGVGLCQYGANVMAEMGYTYLDILKYYFTGTEVRKHILPSIKKPLYGKTIIIDPGHGGEDEGYKGDTTGLLEKDLALKLALRLKAELTDLGMQVHLTREEDITLSITERIEEANRIRSDFFISIHADYFNSSSLKGCEIFHFRKDYNSQKLGFHILRNLKDKDIVTRGVKEGNFYIFRGVSTSSLLIEIGYLSNPDEEQKFLDESYLESIVQGIVEGIIEYYK